MKIPLKRLWEVKLDWDDPAPNDVQEVWSRWRMELPSLSLQYTSFDVTHPMDPT